MSSVIPYGFDVRLTRRVMRRRPRRLSPRAVGMSDRDARVLSENAQYNMGIISPSEEARAAYNAMTAAIWKEVRRE